MHGYFTVVLYAVSGAQGLLSVSKKIYKTLFGCKFLIIAD